MIINSKKTIPLFLLIILIFLGKNIYAQEDLIQIDTNLVSVPVTVLDRQGRYVVDLKKENFKVFENGIEQEIDYFDLSNNELTVFILLDRSGSMTNYMLELTNASSAFVSQLRPQDNLITATFADDIDVILKLTKVSEIKKGIKIRGNRTDRYTRLYDAVDYTLKKMKKIRGRKAVVVFSDGMGDGTFSSYKDNIEDAEESEVLIYTVQFDTSSKTPSSYVNKKKFYERINEGNAYMQTLAEITGGKHYKIENISNLKETFAQIASELGQQYRLGYYPKNSGKKGERQEIKVKVNVPNVAVRARKSYIVGSDKN
ncbi:MAG: VWA domain-containing protein [Aridibacter sp.]